MMLQNGSRREWLCGQEGAASSFAARLDVFTARSLPASPRSRGRVTQSLNEGRVTQSRTTQPIRRKRGAAPRTLGAAARAPDADLLRQVLCVHASASSRATTP